MVTNYGRKILKNNLEISFDYGYYWDHPLMTNVMIPVRSVQEFIDNVLPTLLSKYGTSVADYFMKIDYNHVGFCRTTIEEAKICRTST